MANADQHPQAHPSGAPHINPVHQSPHLSFWIREMPFSLVLILTIGGVAYTSFSKHPILIYWEILHQSSALFASGMDGQALTTPVDCG